VKTPALYARDIKCAYLFS